jgi:hypothetical protein
LKAQRKERRLVSQLKPYPQQKRIFGEQDDDDINELAADMDLRGQQQPIVILPEGTVLSGHRRLAAAAILGWKDVEVVVCTDLGNDPQAAFEVFLRENASHRKMSKLQITRMYLRLAEIDAQGSPDIVNVRPRTDHMKRLQQLLGGCGRNCQRWFKAAQTPQEVQDALETNEIHLNDAARVMTLSPAERDAFAGELRAGRNVKEVVRGYLTHTTSNSDSFAKHLRTLSRAIAQALRDHEVSRHDLPDDAARHDYTSQFRDGARLLNQLAKWNQKALKRQPSDTESVEWFRAITDQRMPDEEEGI